MELPSAAGHAGEAHGPPSWPRIIGILGGLGPHAHVELERCLLEAVGQPAHEQAYPTWYVASLPGTPDRTRALLGEGPSPAPALVEGLRRLEPLVDFAVIACHTAHAFLREVQAQVHLPILNLVEQVIATVSAAPRGPGAAAGRPRRVGLLATTGTLRAALYPDAAARGGYALEFVSLLDLPGGELLQRELVMRPIYGCASRGGGLKSGGLADPVSGRPHVDVLSEAVELLMAEGAECIIPACTELSLALRGGAAGVRVFDPLRILASAALEVASGRRALPRGASGPSRDRPVTPRRPRDLAPPMVR